MTNLEPEDTDEKPLDPAVARVQARLQRLMLIAGLTLGVGILAVFLAIIYRITTSDNKPSEVAVNEIVATPTATASGEDAGQAAPKNLSERASEAMLVAETTIPADARLVASTVAGGRIVLTYEHFAGTILILVDPATLQIAGRLELKPE